MHVSAFVLPAGWVIFRSVLGKRENWGEEMDPVSLAERSMRFFLQPFTRWTITRR